MQLMSGGFVQRRTDRTVHHILCELLPSTIVSDATRGRNEIGQLV